MEEKRKPETTRDRLLQSAARLLSSQGVAVSTRAICEDAGVTAPTLYHYFGDRDGLLQAVVTHGFGEYLARKRSLPSTGDPIEDLRLGWDDHSAWGVSNPAFYALMYGQVKPGYRAPAAAEGEQLLIEKLEAAARRGLLRVPAAVAARMILAANVGMTLQLISQPDSAGNELSSRLREITLAGVLALDGSDSKADGVDRAIPASALSLKAALAADPSQALGDPEQRLLDAWLDRLAGSPGR
jgi:AcrR family transcriptional regulator